MSKYDPLAEMLERSDAETLPLSFEDVEAILGFSLPMSARKHRPWWSNDANSSHVQARAWLRAGYSATQVDMDRETLVFVRSGERDHAMGSGRKSPVHPVIGCMKGTVTIAPGVDLTEPAMPEWADMVENAKLYNE